MIKGYTYDEFGNLTQDANSFLNEITYGGSVTDTSSGLQYMDSRYYEPSTGRFLTQDSYSGNPYDPWTQHLYSYCGNNPTNMVDPTGHNGEWVQWIDTAQKLKETASTLWAADGPLPFLDFVSAALLVIGGASWVGGKIGEAIDNSKQKTSEEHAKPGPQPAGSKTYEKTTIQDVIDGTFDKPWLKDRSMSDKVAEAIDKAKATPFVDTKTDTKSLPKGQTVYRVCGGTSKIWGGSWTPINPKTVDDFRDKAGLPTHGKFGHNSGEILVTGKLYNPIGVTARLAVELDGNKGGLLEYMVPEPQWNHVYITSIEFLDKAF